MLRAFAFIVPLFMLVLSPVSSAADLDLSPVTLFKCWRALRKLSTKATPTVPAELSKTLGGQTVSVPVFTRLNSEQLKKIVEVAPEGTKGQALGFSYRTVDGSLKVIFWPQKALDGSVSYREAAETIIQGELKAVRNYLSQPRNEKLSLLLETQENLTALLEQLKTSSQVPQEITERFVGFKVHAKRSGPSGELQIESVDFDPIFNGRSSIGSLWGWTEEFQGVIEAVAHSIAPKYRPPVYRVEESLVNSYLGPRSLKAPNGSQITGFSDK